MKGLSRRTSERLIKLWSSGYKLFDSLPRGKRDYDLFVLPAWGGYKFSHWCSSRRWQTGRHPKRPTQRAKEFGNLRSGRNWNQPPLALGTRGWLKRRSSKIDLIHVPEWPSKGWLPSAMEEAITIAIWQISTERDCQHHLCLPEVDFAPALMIFQYRRFLWMTYWIVFHIKFFTISESTIW